MTDAAVGDFGVVDNESHGVDLVCLVCHVVVGSWTNLTTDDSWPSLDTLVGSALDHDCEGPPG